VASIKIGINMAGAISAGAYTAGVLDFLTEALDEWEEAKAGGQSVPMHDVCIEVMSGASAGGMCAAISSVMLNQEFEHIHDTSKTGTTNVFYESWVNRIDITELLKSDDLQKNSQLISLLDSTIISKIADFALTPGTLKQRSYVSRNLTLYLSLTNLRGTPYSLNGEAPGSVEETTFFYGDRIRFQTQLPGTNPPPDPKTHFLDFSNKDAPEWGTLRTSAMATGAFPIFLAARILSRNRCEYTPPMWESVTAEITGNPPPVSPNFPPNTPNPMQTLNVDGGVTNNNPFIYAHDYLARLNPPVDRNQLTVPGGEVDRLVINVAPFPTTNAFDVNYNPITASNVFSIIGTLFSALLSQSRFFGEALTHVMNGTTFDRFVIAPSDQELVDRYKGKKREDAPPALQCATLGAFGGFFCRGFRAHDYELGRRNCQKFLQDWFALPQDNPLIEAGLRASGGQRDTIVQKFGVPPPLAYKESAEQPSAANRATAGPNWIPVIPLCGTAVEPIAPIPRVMITGKMLDNILDLIMQRFKAVMSVVLSNVRSTPLRLFLRLGQPVIRSLARSPLRETLVKGLGDSYQP
jgi:predicted acylesterase/phospholipase RssA